MSDIKSDEKENDKTEENEISNYKLTLKFSSQSHSSFLLPLKRFLYNKEKIYF